MTTLHSTSAKAGIGSKTTKFIGALFLIAMAASLSGGIIIESILSSPNYLATLSDNKFQLLIGVLLELINGIAVVGIGVLMFSILKEYNESMALGYLFFRIIEAVFCCMIVITPLSLIKLSQEHLRAGASDLQYFQASGVLSLAERAGIADLLIPVFFSLGALLFYFLLFKSKILPRFISVWGIAAAAAILVINISAPFQTDALSTGLFIVLALPIILNEIFLGIWLIIKGFNSKIIAK